MFCRNCGKEVADQAVMCVACGCDPRTGKKFCQNCGVETNPAAEVCVKCGVKLATSMPADAKSKLAAGLLGIFLGGFGVHRFYLGYVGIGIAQIVVTLITCGIGAIWGFIEGILILVGTIDKDAQGRPLKD
ncbi:MAG: NINE protein [Candidatus Abyssobacteria bacterium SURF_17]|uniref:NINE protein n=1 Tax=Candidatus Abyssobacteria bacterium SURF_17 TaxID=2093361 RepID=A0A419F1L4_9BACT|nr:MAG: NINE protein [Candidatus Abyssubacteria bacterium SURF_17]